MDGENSVKHISCGNVYMYGWLGIKYYSKLADAVGLDVCVLPAAVSTRGTVRNVSLKVWCLETLQGC